jgi:hypothetical protein
MGSLGELCALADNTAGKGAHTFAEGEPITLGPTVGRDLEKREFAQRFLVVPW